MDAPWDEPLTMGKAKVCAGNVTGVVWKDVNACYTGDRGSELLAAASKVFTAQFPKVR